MSISLVPCKVCGLEFSGSSNAAFCSDRCKQQNYRISKRTRGYIYKLKKGGVVVYVGQSISLKTLSLRIQSHKSGERPKEFDSHEFYEVNGCNVAEVEAAEIMMHRPIYNLTLPSSKNYCTVKSFCSKLNIFMEEIVRANFITTTLGDSDNNRVDYIKNDEIEGFKEKIRYAFKS